MRRFGWCLVVLSACGPLAAQGYICIDAPRCSEMAAQIQNQCLQAGGDPAECEALKAAFMANCGQVAPPSPPPPPSCLEECERAARAQLQGCLAAIDPQDPEAPQEAMECHQQYRAALGGCETKCVPDGDCLQRCRAEAEAARAECRAQGGGQRQCDGVYNEALRACMEACLPPPDLGCKELCVRRAEGARAKCHEDGGTRLQCEATYMAVLRECARRCDGDGDDVPPPPLGCPGRCVEEALKVFEECVEAGGDPPACRQKAAEVLKTCLAGCEHVPPFLCQEQCRFKAAEVHEACVAAITIDPALDPEGYAAAVQACADVRKATFEECSAACQTPPEPPACEDRCETHAKYLYDACVACGGDPAECETKAGGFLEQCMARCDEMPPPSCGQQCGMAAREALEACLKEPEADPEECVEEARKILEECRLNCEVPNPPGCKERCGELASKIAAECKAACGGDPDCEAECDANAERVRARCAAGCPGEPKPCPDVCALRARVYQKLCEETGGDPERCAFRAGRILEECRDRCQEPPKPVPCAERCARQARRMYSDCIEAGGNCEDCREQAKLQLRECLSGCAPQPVPCEKECAVAARQQLAACLDTIEAKVKECVDAGGDPKACRREAVASCRREVNANLAACLQECGVEPPPVPPTCEERCDQLAARIRTECVAQGGTEAECAAAAVEFQARCKAKCRLPEPPGPCDVDCGQLAAEVQARCEAAGGTDCAKVAEEFKARCEARVAEACAGEEIAWKAPPRDFQRGDSNRDGKRDISDAIHTLHGLFLGGGGMGCADAIDANDDGQVDISDAVMTLRHLFMGGIRLPEPMGDGQDPTADDLICE